MTAPCTKRLSRPSGSRSNVKGEGGRSSTGLTVGFNLNGEKAVQ